MGLYLWLGVLLSGFLPAGSETVVRDSVDLVEVNHYHDPRGQAVFDQLIFYDWSHQKRRFQVRAWRLIKSESQLPRRDHRDGHWLVRWHDEGLLREVTAVSHRETWTRYDPELAERDYLPQEQRLELSSRSETPQRPRPAAYLTMTVSAARPHGPTRPASVTPAAADNAVAPADTAP